MTRALAVAVVVFVPMLIETAISRSNEARLRARGALEPADDVYPWMLITYPAGFLGMIVESAWRDQPWGVVATTGVAIFALGKGLKYWAMAVLGPLWSFKVLVVPGVPLVKTGPYRWLRHPNYAGIVGELVGAALMAGSPIAGVIAFVTFGGIMLARIRVEERALNL
jgi:methyltransferase